MKIQIVGTTKLVYNPNKISIDTINNHLSTHLDKFDTIEYEKVNDTRHIFTTKFLLTTNRINDCKTPDDYNSYIKPLLDDLLPYNVTIAAVNVYDISLNEKNIDHIITPMADYFNKILKDNN